MPKCKHCLTKFEVKFFNQKFCILNDECRSAATQYAIAQKEKNFKAKCVTDRREYKEKNKSYAAKVLEARKVFQAWIRNRDKDLSCICCNITKTPIWDGGHYLKAELFSGLIFDERNVHKQSRHCNSFKGGNELNYRDGLIKRYGKDFVEQLESEKDAKRVYKWSDKELENIKQKYKL